MAQASLVGAGRLKTTGATAPDVLLSKSARRASFMSSDHAVVAPSKSAAGSQKNPEPSRGLWQRQPLWLIFLTVMIANYVMAHLFFPASSSITVPYTFFKQQVQAGNVENVSSTGDSIRGTFKTEVTYPPQSSTASAQLPGSRLPARTCR